MELKSQLMPKLKNLRLSGILETLEVRIQQAIEEKCTYVEFLQKLLEDEVERRGQKQLSLRLRRSNLDFTKTLEAFDFSFNPTLNRQQIYDLATCAFLERGESVLLVGPAGVGKSHLAQALGHEACRRGFDVIFTRTSEMLSHLHAGRADGSNERRPAMYQRPEVLILDDFGLKPMRPPSAEDLYEVIEGRYGRGAIIPTNNRVARALRQRGARFGGAGSPGARRDATRHHRRQRSAQGPPQPTGIGKVVKVTVA
ncbi:MAG TPA: ATP-binding protein [Planctomycetota bacterium]|nr:ATP-binding protein [Planctomycetota bacterium]